MAKKLVSTPSLMTGGDRALCDALRNDPAPPTHICEEAAQRIAELVVESKVLHDRYHSARIAGSLTAETTVDERTCKVCQYWTGTYTKFTTGSCRRYAPRPERDVQACMWTETDADDWCGEWAPVDRAF